MLPTIQVFNKTIAMYGTMILIGLLIGVAIAALRSKKYMIESEDIIFSSCYGGIGLLIGAKLFYLITVIPEIIRYHHQIIANFSAFSHLISGGFVFYGGLIGAAVGYYIYCRQYHINLGKLLDIIAPSIPIMHGFGRIGCFFAGCCYGIKYDGPLHIIFHNSPVGPNQLSLFPVQLLESCLNFLVGIFLLIYSKPHRRQGKVLGIYLIYYATARFILEYLRGDISRGFILGISTSQWISIVLMPIGILIFFGSKSSRQTEEK